MLNDAQGEGVSATGLSYRVTWRSDRRVLPTRIIDERLTHHDCSTRSSTRLDQHLPLHVAPHHEVFVHQRHHNLAGIRIGVEALHHRPPRHGVVIAAH